MFALMQGFSKSHSLVCLRNGCGSQTALEKLRKFFELLNQRADALLAEAGHMDVALEEVIALIKDRHKNLNSNQK